MKPGAPLHLEVDLRGLKGDGKLKGTHKVPKAELPARRRKQTNNLYEDVWFSASGKLIDSSAFAVKFTDHVTQMKLVKTGRSGKTKFQTKFKVVREGILSLKPGDSAYDIATGGGPPVPLEDGSGKVAIKEKEGKGATILVKRSEKTKPFDLQAANAMPKVRLFTDLMGEAMRQIKSAPPPVPGA
jgi:hypothetical protein